MKYVQYYRQCMIDKSNHAELLGCDGVHIVDGRLSNVRIISVALKQANILNSNLGKGITGFRIMMGESFSSSKPISEFVKL